MTQAQLFKQKSYQSRDPRLDEKVPVDEMAAWLEEFARTHQVGPYKPAPKERAANLAFRNYGADGDGLDADGRAR